ncbi:beta-barrel assembly complex subunit BamF [Aliiruegeria haliotis]|uniref:Beta-barrel assembly complex subunit BamF n=1 Tax=Aliiruegeria haliotis TaxID=1280846 RepID=A0A2T0RT87_9RHOB|nr:DUF3035 domain-containing protein [Aliiruegeria haliotis]PRY24320.1 beta-barrel assembly complex subunit BamF [Aliiruegeria haliotis]
MRAAKVARAGIMLALVALVAACSRGDPSMMHIQRGMTTPDEFAILPNKPIETPPNYNDLPAPNPLGGNRTDVNPEAEAIAALGGNPARVVRDGKIVADSGLIRHTTRYGVEQNVRANLALEDLEYRKRNRGRALERLFQVPTYYSAYERQAIDQHGALWYYRARGLPTPAAPSDPEVD